MNNNEYRFIKPRRLGDTVEGISDKPGTGNCRKRMKLKVQKERQSENGRVRHGTGGSNRTDTTY